MMAEVDIKSLFNHGRFPGGVRNFNLILYFPIGLFLALVRIFISLHVIVICQVLPHGSSIRRFVLKVMSGVLGFLVTVEDGDKIEACPTKVIVSNHISVIDNFLTDLVFPSTSPVEKLPSIFIQLVSNFKKLPSAVNKDEMLKDVQTICQESTIPVLFHPEKTTTNGTKGLLKFSTLPFELDETIQPVAVQCKRPPYFEISMTTLNSNWFGDIFWCFFVPCTFYKISILPVVKKKEEESWEELTERVRSIIAKCINVETTELTHSDKTELLKQRHRTAPSTSVSMNTNNTVNNTESVSTPQASPCLLSNDPLINNMVQQVKTVMPHVPVSAILQDIEKTKDIDVTITNILDGIVEFTPEATDNQKNNESNQKKILACPSTQKFMSTTFGRTTKDRQMSFEERKNAMIEAARQKYKEKNSLV